MHTVTLLLPVTSSGKSPIRHVTSVWDLELSLKGLTDILLKKTGLISLKEGSERSPWVVMVVLEGTLGPSDTPGIWVSETKSPPAGLVSWYFPFQTPKVREQLAK